MAADEDHGQADGVGQAAGEAQGHGHAQRPHEAVEATDGPVAARIEGDGSAEDGSAEDRPEFVDDPGTGFGYADASDVEAESELDRDVGSGMAPGMDSGVDSGVDPEVEAEDRADAEEAAAAYARASLRDFEQSESGAAADADAEEPLVAHRGEKPRQLVIVNDTPGEETRIAILEQGRLGQFFTERAATATNVGSIYKARIVNVEPAIQAAFVDFGEGANGFLHVSDLHPKYFPGSKGDGESRTEKVGRKIPRRARPLIQDALRRGMEITVQVLKEGLGSKGPTVTSYLSIPGRLLVMMPDMDNVGVSRKVEDEEGRRRMRKILDSLNLPEGFGFILRTAGFDATRSELARDAEYLQRLWNLMEKRSSAVGAPCRLYAEGDILLRTIRDSIDSSVDGIVVDSENAFHRAKAFLEVVSPRTAAKVHFYDRRRPVFHAFDVERQVDMIHAREVPLPSGGALVFDQTEALVAIDVNSGRSRSARDSETNAYQTNQEAVDEIARQLRLRDLGGVIVCDLIDMRHARHRRDIEERLRKNLSKDRAKSTVTEISEFGIVELTRQRMRPSLRKTHYHDCPHCAGTGEIRIPDAVAADALRRAQRVLDLEKVARVEMVCSARVASVFVSRRRRALVELEDLFSKKVGIRISDAIPVDRVDLYAYDERDADVELDRPEKLQIPALASLPTEVVDESEDAGEGGQGEGSGGGEGRGRRRRRRRRKPAAADATSMILSGGFDDLPDVDEDEPSISDAIAEAERAESSASRESADADAGIDASGSGEGGRRRRRRRRRGGGGRDGESREDVQGGQDAERDPGVEPGRSGGASRSARPARPVAPPPPREPSPPIRVHALAKEIELTSKDVLAKCAELGIEVKGHQSLLAGEQGDAVRKAYGKPPFDVPEPAAEPDGESEGDGEFDGEFDGGGETATSDASVGQAGEGGGRRKRRRRRRGGRGRDRGEGGDGGPDRARPEGARETNGRTSGSPSIQATSWDGDAETGGGGNAEPRAGHAAGEGGERTRDGSGRRGRRRRRRGGGGGGGRRDGERRDDRPRENQGPAAGAPAPATPKPRSLYGGRVRKLAPGERPKGGGDE